MLLGGRVEGGLERPSLEVGQWRVRSLSEAKGDKGLNPGIVSGMERGHLWHMKVSMCHSERLQDLETTKQVFIKAVYKENMPARGSQISDLRHFRSSVPTFFFFKPHCSFFYFLFLCYFFPLEIQAGRERRDSVTSYQYFLKET